MSNPEFQMYQINEISFYFTDMSKTESKSKRLKNSIHEFQCYSCKNVPSPSDFKRYLCIEKSHHLCYKCKLEKCICGSLVARKSSKIISKIVQNGLWFCKYYKDGCRKLLPEKSLKKHQKKCNFAPVERCILTPVSCPQSSCQETFRFSTILKHIKESHGLSILEKADESKNRYYFTIKKKRFVAMESLPVKMFCIPSGERFFLSGYIHHGVRFLFAYLFDPTPRKAKKYQICLGSKPRPNINQSYKGPASPLQRKMKDLQQKGFCFVVAEKSDQEEIIYVQVNCLK